MKKAVVTGGAGFIGSHVVDALAADGWHVLAVDDLSTGREENLKLARAATQVDLVVADICSDKAAAAVRDFKPQVVFHHGAQINVRRSVTEPLFDAEKNILGTMRMIEAAKEGGAEQFVFASTGGAIYGEQETFPATEEHRIRPECPYGVSKRCAELYLEYYSRTFKLPVTVLRYGNVYGPRQNPKGEAGVVAIFTQNLIAGKPLKVNGDGKQTRDFVYVGDVAQANLLAVQKPSGHSFRIYNVGLGIESTVLDIIAAMQETWKKLGAGRGGADVEVIFSQALAGEQRRSVIEPKKIKRELGWVPTVQLPLGIEQTVKSFL